MNKPAPFPAPTAGGFWLVGADSPDMSVTQRRVEINPPPFPAPPPPISLAIKNARGHGTIWQYRIICYRRHINVVRRLYYCRLGAFRRNAPY
jgi:hypothetical protein